MRLEFKPRPANTASIFGVTVRMHANGQAILHPEVRKTLEQLSEHADRTGRSLFVYGSKAMHRLESHRVETVDALKYNSETRAWEKIKAPAPHVLIRDYSDRDENRVPASILQHRVVRLVPQSALTAVMDKLTFSHAMQNARIMQPQTHEFSSKRMEDMLDEHGTIFLKDRKGSLGNGIAQIEMVGPNEVKLTHVKNQEQKSVQFNRDELRDRVEQFMKDAGKEKSGFIVQRGLADTPFRGRKFSFRVLMHQTETGPGITGIIARVGKPGSIVDNVSKGGEVTNHIDVLKSVFRNRHRHVATKLEEVCREAFHAVQTESGFRSALPLGELGLDVMFEGENPIVIEANSRPGMSVQSPLFPNYREQVFRTGEILYRQLVGSRLPGRKIEPEAAKPAPRPRLTKVA